MRRLPALIIGIAVVIAPACSTSTHHMAGPTTVASTGARVAAGSPWPTSEDQSQIEQDIASKGLTTQRALMLFSIEVGPLPGVPAHSGSVATSEFDGSRAVTDLDAVWAHLTPAQQKAAAELLSGSRLTQAASARAHGRSPLADPAAQTSTTVAGGPAPPTTVALPRAAGQVRVEPAALAREALPRPGAPAARAVDPVPTWDYWEMAVEANTVESEKLGVAPIASFGIDVDYGPPVQAYAETSMWHDDGTPWDVGCHLTIWDQKFNGISDQQAQAVIDHEMFHCYENRAAGTRARYATVRQWLADGACDWVMAMISPLGTGVLNDYWNTYINTPATPYWNRGYDAVGVFGHFGDVVGQDAVWPNLLPAVVAGIGDHDTAALTTLSAGVTQQFFSSWGASYFEEAGRHNWSTEGPSTTPTTGPAPQSLQIGNGAAAGLTPAPEGAVALTTVTTSADVVIVYPDSGYGMLHDADHTLDFALDTSGPIGLCMKDGGCACPDGSPGASTVTTPAKGPLSIGLAGGDQAATGAVSGVSLDSFCKKPDQPGGNQPELPPGGGGGGGGGAGNPPSKKPEPGGGSTGDPHLLTYDGERYDFQTVGEFTLTRSTSGDFEVQQRNAAVPGSRQIAINKAVAVRVGHDRLEWSLETGDPVRRLDGAVVAAAPPKVGTATLASHPSMFGPVDTLTLADGTIVRVTLFGRFGFNVEVLPAPSRRGKLEGLLGNDDGIKGNDLDAGGGKHVPAATGTTDQIDHLLADRWRVTQASSLLWYADGKGTADFTDRAFPYQGEPANLTEARKACADAGITEPALVHDCVVDFAGTGSPLFTLLYGYGQAVDEAKAGRSGSGPATVDRSIHLSGDITKANLAEQQRKLTMDLTVKAGDVLRITDPGTCQDVGGSMWLYVPARGNQPQVGSQVCGIERMQFPTAGKFHVTGSINPGTVGHFDFTIRWVRPDRVENAHYGETLAGTIPGPGEHDDYWFDGKAGDAVKLWGPGCDNGGMLVGLRTTQNVELAFGDPCNKQTFATLKQDGRYELDVNDSDSASGTYAFVLQK